MLGLSGDQGGEGVAADRDPELREHDIPQLVLGPPLVLDRLQKPDGVLDPPDDVAVQDDILLVLGQELHLARLVDQQPVVVPVQGFDRLGPLHLQPGLGVGPYGIPEAGDHHVLRLIDHEEHHASGDRDDPGEHHQNHSRNDVSLFHRYLLVPWHSQAYSKPTTLPFNPSFISQRSVVSFLILSSTNTFFTPGRIFSMVSR